MLKEIEAAGAVARQGSMWGDLWGPKQNDKYYKFHHNLPHHKPDELYKYA